MLEVEVNLPRPKFLMDVPTGEIFTTPGCSGYFMKITAEDVNCVDLTTGITYSFAKSTDIEICRAKLLVDR